MATPYERSYRSFACEVVRNLRQNARELRKVEAIKAFCCQLDYELDNVRSCLEDSEDESVQVIKQEWIRKLLDSLERVCQFPLRSDNLSASGETIIHKRYPTLTRALADRQDSKDAMRGFASSPSMEKNKMKLLKFLAEFEKSKSERVAPGPSLSEFEVVDAQESEDYRSYIQTLSAVLLPYCRCGQGIDQIDITGNLRLKSCWTPGGLDNRIDFRLFFPGHPHHDRNGNPCGWKDTEIQVPKQRSIRLKEDATKRESPPKTVPKEAFCDVISKRKRAQIRMTVEERSLIELGPGLPQGFSLDKPSISLAQLISCGKPNKKLRLLLSCLLAKAVWQFYDSPFMYKPWTKDAIHFMFEGVCDGRIFIHEPFLATSFEGRKQQKDREEPTSEKLHYFPKILALGIMLLEIELSMKIEELEAEGMLDLPDQERMDEYYIAAWGRFNEEDWDKNGTFLAVHDCIKICLDPGEFDSFRGDVQVLREEFSKRIVKPLQVLYQTNWKNDPYIANIPGIDLDQLKSPNLKNREGTTSRGGSRKRRPKASKSQAKRASPQSEVALLGATSSDRSHRTSKDWFKSLDRLNHRLRPKLKDMDQPYRATKIAILDTGVNEVYGPKLKGFKDFVSRDGEDWRDNTGHGTSAVELIGMVYDKAEFYIGRVFEYSHATDKTVSLMTEAIYHSIKNWKVDIIVIPSGFANDDPDLEEAINIAQASKILIFAAASNYGNCTRIAFPGRLYTQLKLFCLFACDSYNRPGSNFNPSASSKGQYNFAILGEDVLHPNPGISKILSGTSYATMIAAALAGRILDFSRQTDNPAKISNHERLQTVGGMAAVFMKMSIRDNRYDCVIPWRLLPPWAHDEDYGKDRVKVRAYICETMSRALSDI